MAKADMIAQVAKLAGETKACTEKVVDALVEYVVAATKKGEKVQLTGLGIFASKKRSARTGINPATKQKIKIAATTVPTFKAAKSYKDAFKKTTKAKK